MSENERIGHRAHQIWEREGRPDGAHERHWREAVASLLAEDDAAKTSSKKAAVKQPKPEGDAKPKKTGAKKEDAAKKKGGAKKAKKAE